MYPSCLRKSSSIWRDCWWYCNSDSTKSFKQRKWWFYKSKKKKNSLQLNQLVWHTWELFNPSNIKRVISNWRSNSAWAWRNSVSELFKQRKRRMRFICNYSKLTSAIATGILLFVILAFFFFDRAASRSRRVISNVRRSF